MFIQVSAKRVGRPDQSVDPALEGLLGDEIKREDSWFPFALNVGHIVAVYPNLDGDKTFIELVHLPRPILVKEDTLTVLDRIPPAFKVGLDRKVFEDYL